MNVLKFVEFVHAGEAQHRCSLEAMLKTPLQTIMMYPFLFHQLIAKTELGHPHYQNLMDAADAMNGICRDIDEIGSELGQMAEKYNLFQVRGRRR